MASLITNILNGTFGSTGQTRFFETGANLKVEKTLFDFKFTVPSNYTGKWDFLKKVLITMTLRLGADNGGAIPLISDVPVYDLLELSDYKAGVSMDSTTFTAGQVVRISGTVPHGFFSMDSRDALEVALQVTDQSVVPADIEFVISTVYEEGDKLSYLMVYKSAKPTGADMPYKNVLEAYYTGDSVVNKQISVIDQEGAKPVNIEDCIALSNAEGEFEFFKRFGRFYVDPFGLSQDLTFRVPVDDVNATLLIVQYAFNTGLLQDNAGDTAASRNALLAKTRNSDSEKYSFLQMIGAV